MLSAASGGILVALVTCLPTKTLRILLAVDVGCISIDVSMYTFFVSYCFIEKIEMAKLHSINTCLFKKITSTLLNSYY